MESGFEEFARMVFERAGVLASNEDLALVALIHAGYEGNSAVLEEVDTTRFPFEPIDPSRAPDR